MVNVKGSSHKASVSGTHIISFPHHDIQHHQKEDKENDNNFLCLFFFLFSTYFITFANLLNYSDTNIHS